MRLAAAAIVFAAILPFACRAQQPAPASRPLPALPPSVELLPDVVFGTGGGRDLTLDIVRPRVAPAKRMPAIVFIHGGAWQNGSSKGGIGGLVPFAKEGYFGASINYRFTQEAVFPAQIEDCKCAIRFLRAHAAAYNIDAAHIGVWGASAGGHLVALLGTAPDVPALEGTGGWSNQSSRVQAVCDWFGPTDFLSITNAPPGPNGRIWGASGSPEARLLGGPVLEHLDTARQASPVCHITRDAPPFLILHGDQDPTVPFQQSVTLAAALKQAGVPVTFETLPGAGHGGTAFSTPTIAAQMRAFFDGALRVP